MPPETSMDACIGSMAHLECDWDERTLKAERLGQPGTGDASTSAPSGQCAPITQLLWHLSRFKALAAERELANAAIAPLVRQLPFDQELAMLFSRFGWHPEGVFTSTLDLAGLKGALQKYKYIKIGQLGSGSYGVVHKAINRETHELLAIKKVVHSEEHGLSDSTIREIATLRELRHENIVRLKDIIATVNGSHVHMVLECLECDLRQYLDECPEASEIGRIKSIMFQILRGVRHAHAHSIMHRDLKPQNILIGLNSSIGGGDGVGGRGSGGSSSSECGMGLGSGSGWGGGSSSTGSSNGSSSRRALGGGGGGVMMPGGGGGGHPGRVQHAPPPVRVKITDFGLARCFLPSEDRAYTERVVTLYYRAPELLLGAQHYSSGVDTWSVGCILAEMVNFEPLFRADTEIGLLFRMFERLGTPTSDLWRELPGLANFSDQFPRFAPRPMCQLVPRLANDPAGLDLLSRLLTYDPRQRITASQALEHPWFRDVRI